MNKKHPLAKKSVVSLADLAKFHIISYHEESPVYDEMKALLQQAEYELDVEYAYNDEITLSSLVNSDTNDVALLCYSFLVKAFDDVVYLPLQDAPREFHKVYLISNKTITQPRVVSDFVTYAKKTTIFQPQQYVLYRNNGGEGNAE